MPHPRLEDAVRIVASHADFAGKDGVVRGCVAEIDRRWRTGHVTRDEKERLIRILRGECPNRPGIIPAGRPVANRGDREDATATRGR